MTHTDNFITNGEPTILARDRGAHLHFLNHLATIKVAAENGSALSAVEFVAEQGMGPPLHRHEHEDELFVVFDGLIMFLAGYKEVVTRAGATAFLPRGLPHTFQVLTPKARFLAVTASHTDAGPQFDQMVATLGTPASNATLPEPSYIDPAHVADVCRRFGIEVLGPPPEPIED